MIELLDAVDDNDHVIRCMSREDIHKFSLRHRASMYWFLIQNNVFSYKNGP